MTGEKHDTERVLARLKDFQQRTAEYVYRRFYTDSETTDRFLVADEVGLGKTLVARGIIARAIDYLQKNDNKRIDIVYICSNVSIASQNVHRLNVTGVQEFVQPTRLALMPLHINGMRKNYVNYISLTPGTSFDPKSREGKDEERALIYRLLKGRLSTSYSGFKRLLQCRVSDNRWQWWTDEWKPEDIDKKIADDFVKNVMSDHQLHQRITDFCARSKRRVLWNDPERLGLISELRFRLAEMSVEILEPELIILDEFQRFKNLLDQGNPDARLAQRLFKYPGVKTLLLSATPYKMLSLDHEQEDDHYADLLNTLRFLFDSEAEVVKIKKEIQAFRESLYFLGSGEITGINKARDMLQSSLCRVMCRTERASTTGVQDAMIREIHKRPSLQARDLHEATLADRVASSVDARDIIEYWKSSPYLINFLRRYEFRRKLDEQCDNASDELLSALEANKNRLLQRNDIQSYKEINPANPRMRDLFSQTIDNGLWKALWLPPSMPYTKPEGLYADIQNVTKTLVFSAWNVVPDAIASLCSYEAERRMVALLPRQVSHDQLYDKLRPLLRYTRSDDGRLTGMPVFNLLYPSPILASLVDPLKLALEYDRDGLIQNDVLLERTAAILGTYIQGLLDNTPNSTLEDQRWYWAAPAMLDAIHFPDIRQRLINEETWWLSINGDGTGERGERFKDHLDLFCQAMNNKLDPPLGRPPVDLTQVLAQMAVAGPGVCALRALRRVTPSLSWDAPELLQGAVQVSEGFRTLFNLPETIALLRGTEPDTFYWKIVLRYCLEGNIQSLLDEQTHCLVESLGVIDEAETERAEAIGESMGSSLSIRTSQLQLDEVLLHPQLHKVEFKSYNTRCRFALRFAELKDEKGATVARADVVRDAFNSPFRPFVLASTSIGQEGLDFHTWCHAVNHWNLPSNPVDLEQREGRVHRYKGHAIRKNIVMRYGLDALRKNWDGNGDPWHFMFEMAKRDRPSDASDLVPYWLYDVEGGAHIERRVPILAFSKEEAYFIKLKRMLAIYRLVFGQPRQEDLLEYLESSMGRSCDESNLSMWRISLEPPKVY
ncbi:MAG: helicase-related protein [Deltaproteobacteria bacterium]